MIEEYKLNKIIVTIDLMLTIALVSDRDKDCRGYPFYAMTLQKTRARSGNSWHGIFLSTWQEKIKAKSLVFDFPIKVIQSMDMIAYNHGGISAL